MGMRDQKHGSSLYLLAFTEEMCFDEEPQKYPNIFPDKLLIHGSEEATRDLQVCQLKRKELIVNHENLLANIEEEQKVNDSELARREKFQYRYEVGFPVREGELYTVFFPRLF